MAKKTKKGKKTVKKKVTKKVKAKKGKKCACKKVDIKVGKKPFNKSQIVGAIADITCLSKKDINCMLDALFEVVAAHLKKRGGSGEFTLPNIAKFRVVSKPATKARKGINPFTGEPMMFKAKPARNIVKVRALKKVKDAAK